VLCQQPASAEEITSAQYSRAFLVRRWITFVGIVLGYACYYLTRNSLTYTAPVMVADPLLNMDITMVSSTV
jgi:sugar phosphate permease